jgi:hypothetical protein
LARESGAERQPGEEALGRYRKAFLLRLPPELMEELRRWSSAELRSLNAHIEYLLRDAVRRRGAGGSPADRE